MMYILCMYDAPMVVSNPPKKVTNQFDESLSQALIVIVGGKNQKR